MDYRCLLFAGINGRDIMRRYPSNRASEQSTLTETDRGRIVSTTAKHLAPQYLSHLTLCHNMFALSLFFPFPPLSSSPLFPLSFLFSFLSSPLLPSPPLSSPLLPSPPLSSPLLPSPPLSSFPLPLPSFLLSLPLSLLPLPSPPLPFPFLLSIPPIYITYELRRY